jgi:hypothetical protein
VILVEGFGGPLGVAGFAGSFGFRDKAFGGGAGFGGSITGTFRGLSGDLAGHEKRLRERAGRGGVRAHRTL